MIKKFVLLLLSLLPLLSTAQKKSSTIQPDVVACIDTLLSHQDKLSRMLKEKFDDLEDINMLVSDMDTKMKEELLQKKPSQLRIDALHDRKAELLMKYNNISEQINLLNKMKMWGDESSGQLFKLLKE